MGASTGSRPSKNEPPTCGWSPPELLDHFRLSPFLIDNHGHELLYIQCAENSSSVEFRLYHQHGFPDPVIYAHLADTLNGQIKVLLYVINNPLTPRFDVDKLPDGTPTRFGTQHRNLLAEEAALAAGYAPGQVRGGLRLFAPGLQAFEAFLRELGHTMYFLEPRPPHPRPPIPPARCQPLDPPALVGPARWHPGRTPHPGLDV